MYPHEYKNPHGVPEDLPVLNWMDLLEQVAARSRGGRVLEVGAATGSDTPRLESGQGSVVAVDVKPGRLIRGKERGNFSQGVSMNMENLGFSDNVFAGVFLANCLIFGDPKQTITEALRVVEPGGFVTICTNLIPGPSWAGSWAEGHIQRVLEQTGASYVTSSVLIPEKQYYVPDNAWPAFLLVDMVK